MSKNLYILSLLFFPLAVLRIHYAGAAEKDPSNTYSARVCKPAPQGATAISRLAEQVNVISPLVPGKSIHGVAGVVSMSLAQISFAAFKKSCPLNFSKMTPASIIKAEDFGSGYGVLIRMYPDKPGIDRRTLSTKDKDGILSVRANFDQVQTQELGPQSGSLVPVIKFAGFPKFDLTNAQELRVISAPHSYQDQPYSGSPKVTSFNRDQISLIEKRNLADRVPIKLCPVIGEFFSQL